MRAAVDFSCIQGGRYASHPLVKVFQGNAYFQSLVCQHQNNLDTGVRGLPKRICVPPTNFTSLPCFFQFYQQMKPSTNGELLRKISNNVKSVAQRVGAPVSSPPGG